MKIETALHPTQRTQRTCPCVVLMPRRKRRKKSTQRNRCRWRKRRNGQKRSIKAVFRLCLPCVRCVALCWPARLVSDVCSSPSARVVACWWNVAFGTLQSAMQCNTTQTSLAGDVHCTRSNTKHSDT